MYLLIGELVLVDTSYGVVVVFLVGDLVGDEDDNPLTGDDVLLVVLFLVGDLVGLDEIPVVPVKSPVLFGLLFLLAFSSAELGAL